VNTGKLIVLEGVDGCGKSTQRDRLADALRRAGREVVATAEPTGGEWGRRIRAAARAGAAVAPEDELDWFTRDRRNHVAEVIRPALAAGKVVVSDRYFLSTVAYQGARGCDAARILVDSEAEFPIPDLVLLLVLPPAIGLERVRERAAIAEPHFEEQEFLTAVAANFAKIDRPYLVRVDADASVDAVTAAIETCVHERLGIL